MITHLSVSSDEQNSRVSFVFDTICDWYGWTWGYCESQEIVDGMRLFYGNAGGEVNGVNISPFPIKEIGEVNSKPAWSEYSGIPNPCSRDPIAGMFYLLTCAEEYQVATKDEHERVRASDLSLVKRGYGSIPLADRLAQVLAKALWSKAGLKGTPEMISESSYSSLDIDQVYAVHLKSGYKKIGNFGRELISRGVSAGLAIFKAALGAKDPFDQFEWIKAEHQKRKLEPYLFILMGYENSTDQAWKPGHKAWPSFIKSLEGWTKLGVHPSYKTSKDAKLLLDEKLRLEALTAAPVTRSRQHFLKIAWPDTFQALIQAEIAEDYSLAWPDWLGFRMGSARSCFWFDLTTNEKTSLRLLPPAAMEVTARFYLGLSPKQFLSELKAIHEEAILSNSGLRILWHNSTLSSVGGWSNWKKVYPSILDLVASRTNKMN